MVVEKEPSHGAPTVDFIPVKQVFRWLTWLLNLWLVQRVGMALFLDSVVET